MRHWIASISSIVVKLGTSQVFVEKITNCSLHDIRTLTASDILPWKTAWESMNFPDKQEDRGFSTWMLQRGPEHSSNLKHALVFPDRRFSAVLDKQHIFFRFSQVMYLLNHRSLSRLISYKHYRSYMWRWGNYSADFWRIGFTFNFTFPDCTFDFCSDAQVAAEWEGETRCGWVAVMNEMQCQGIASSFW